MKQCDRKKWSSTIFGYGAPLLRKCFSQHNAISIEARVPCFHPWTSHLCGSIYHPKHAFEKYCSCNPPKTSTRTSSRYVVIRCVYQYMCDSTPRCSLKEVNRSKNVYPKRETLTEGWGQQSRNVISVNDLYYGTRWLLMYPLRNAFAWVYCEVRKARVQMRTQRRPFFRQSVVFFFSSCSSKNQKKRGGKQT